MESDLAIHPGELLGEEIDVRGMTQKALAEAMMRPPQVVNEIVRGKKAITADTAVQLEDALGISAQLWLGLQTQYDLILARRAQAARRASAPVPRRRAAGAVAEPSAAYRAATPKPEVAPKARAKAASKRE